jgi:hypothetical protein
VKQGGLTTVPSGALIGRFAVSEATVLGADFRQALRCCGAVALPSDVKAKGQFFMENLCHQDGFGMKKYDVASGKSEYIHR